MTKPIELEPELLEPEIFDSTQDKVVRQWGESREIIPNDDQLPSANNTKGLYRQSIRSSSSVYLQHNWPRIVRCQIEDIEKALSGAVTTIHHDAAAKVQSYVDPDVLVEYVRLGGRDSVLKIWSKLSGKISEHSLRIVSDAIHETILEECPVEVVRIATAENDAAAFVLRANRLDKSGYRNAALDLIYERVDELMRSGEFEILDKVMSQLDVNELSLNVLIGVLTATLPARRRLTSRDEFFSKTKQSLLARGENEDGLLTGLQ